VESDVPDLRGVLSGLLASSTAWEMTARLEQSLEVTDGLWDLVAVVETAGEQYDHQDPAEMADLSPAGRRMSAERRTAVRAVADGISALQEEAFAGQEITEADLGPLGQSEVMADPFGVLGRLMDLPGQTELGLAAMSLASGLSGDELLYLRAHMRARDKTARSPLLLRALFITAIGTIEPLVTRLVQLLLFRARPDSYGSMAAVQLEEDARKLCYGPPSKWRASLVMKLGVGRLARAVDWDRLTALWEDRNVLAHRAGLADARHNSATGSQSGSIVSPDADAVRSAINVIGAARFALVACVWAHLEPGSGSLAAGAIWAPICDSLRDGRWEQAEWLARSQELLGTSPQDQAMARVNRWLAIDAGRGPGAIRAEVEDWDTRSLPSEFTLARYVLLHDDGQAISLLHELLSDGVITPDQVDSWPLFDRLRNEGLLGPEVIPPAAAEG
jgi:hypothetical protein